MTAGEAKAEGFTHHGSYYGIPIWIGLVGEAPLVAAKWFPLEYLMTVFNHIEGIVRETMWPDEEPGFMFRVFQEIEPRNVHGTSK